MRNLVQPTASRIAIASRVGRVHETHQIAIELVGLVRLDPPYAQRYIRGHAIHGQRRPMRRPPASSRLLSLDVFRGLTILAMILVNNPGGWAQVPVLAARPCRVARLDADRSHLPVLPVHRRHVARLSLRKYRDGDTIAPAVYWRIVRRTAVLIFLGWMPSLLLKTISYFHGATHVRPEQPPHLRRAGADRARVFFHVADRAPYSAPRPGRARRRDSARLLGTAGLAARIRTTTRRTYRTTATSSASST